MRGQSTVRLVKWRSQKACTMCGHSCLFENFQRFRALGRLSHDVARVCPSACSRVLKAKIKLQAHTLDSRVRRSWGLTQSGEEASRASGTRGRTRDGVGGGCRPPNPPTRKNFLIFDIFRRARRGCFWCFWGQERPCLVQLLGYFFPSLFDSDR